jgi:hypothetical protein
MLDTKPFPRTGVQTTFEKNSTDDLTRYEQKQTNTVCSVITIRTQDKVWKSPGGALSVGVRHRSSSSRLRSASRKAHITGAAWFWVRSLLKCKVLLPFFSQLNSMASITAAPSRDLAFDYFKSLSNAFLGPLSRCTKLGDWRGVVRLKPQRFA